MALIRPKNLKRNVSSTTAPTCANAVHTARFYADLSASTVDNGIAGLLSADLLEIGVLPAGCRLVRVEQSSAGLDASATLDVGIMTGRYLEENDTDGVARTMAATGEILEAATKNQLNTVDAVTLAAITPVAYDRGIGVRISADESANASESITVIIWYAAN